MMNSMGRSMVLLAGLMLAPAQAQPVSPGSIQVVAYVDVLASASRQAAAVLERYRAASRQEPGALGVEVFAQINRPGGFAILEVWQDPAAFEAHGRAPATERLMQALLPMQLAPWDRHAHSLFYGGPAGGGRQGALTLLVHVDVLPPFAEDYAGELKAYIEGSRTDPGLLHVAVLQFLPPHANHFTVIEEWRNASALEAHQKGAVAQTYRARLAAQIGAPFDERAYKKLN